jgi:hypothetical protein
MVAQYVLIALYIAFAVIAQVLAKRIWGTDDLDGCPKWTYGTAMLTQFFVFPAMLALLAVHSTDSMLGAASTDLPADYLQILDECLWIFALYWLKDFQTSMKSLFLLHHAACLLGLSLQLFGMTTARGWGVAMIVIYEIGSFAMNIACLWPRRRAAATLYLVVMSLSNAVGVYANYRLCIASPALWVTVFDVIVMTPMTYMRQKVAWDVFQAGWDDAGGAVQKKSK